jgi:hypothetical protein
MVIQQQVKERYMHVKRLLSRTAVVMMFAAPVALLAGGVASADLTNTAGTVTLHAPGGTSGTPYSSGQTIDVNINANGALGSNNGASGPYNIEECQAPNGVVPTIPTGNCDGYTILPVTTTNADGSLSDVAFTVYALPDSVTFGESAGPGQPVCGVAPNYCVLYIGNAIGASTSFPVAHLFSAPFQIAANGDDGGENPGDGTPESPLPILLPLLGVAVVGGGFTIFARRRRHAA